MIVIESIRNFIKEECPLLQNFGKLFPAAEEGADNGFYMVQIAPSEPIVKRYVNGDSLRRMSFYFSSKEAYENAENIDVSGFYEEFSNWMERCTHLGQLPKLEEGKEAKKLKVITYTYLSDHSDMKSRYQVECEFQYYQRKGE